MESIHSSVHQNIQETRDGLDGSLTSAVPAGALKGLARRTLVLLLSSASATGHAAETVSVLMANAEGGSSAAQSQ